MIVGLEKIFTRKIVNEHVTWEFPANFTNVIFRNRKNMFKNGIGVHVHLFAVLNYIFF